MPTKRIYELAKDYKISSNALLSVLKELGFEPKSHMSVADELVAAIKKKFTEQKQEVKKEMEQQTKLKAAAKKTTRVGSVEISGFGVQYRRFDAQV